jgi:cystathionine beta-lyase/cystathionine gamma-synthase
MSTKDKKPTSSPDAAEGAFDTRDDRPRSMRSFLVHGRPRTGLWDFSHHVVPPISSSSTFRLESAERGASGFCGFAEPATHDFHKTPIYIYERLDEPTRAMLEDCLAEAEGGSMGIAFATGMGAIAAAVGVLVRQGDEVIAHRTLYGCTYSLLTNWMPRFGVSSKYVDLVKLNELEEAIGPKTRVVYFETPVNPTLDLIDLEAVTRIVKSVNRDRSPDERIHVVVDNTFASPRCQRPLEFGVNLVVHSLTKNLCGFGTDMGGVVVGPRSYESDLLLFRKDFGATLSSKAAWPILVYGLPTLDLRMKREQENARRIAEFLSGHSKVARVVYPGRDDFPQSDLARRQMRDFDGNFAPGNMLYFVLKGEDEEAWRRARALVDHIAKHAYTITLAVSLGQVRTLIEMPSSMTHAVVPEEAQVAGHIDPGGLRLAVGVEEAEDILRDLDEALTKS